MQLLSCREKQKPARQTAKLFGTGAGICALTAVRRPLRAEGSKGKLLFAFRRKKIVIMQKFCIIEHIENSGTYRILDRGGIPVKRAALRWIKLVFVVCLLALLWGCGTGSDREVPASADGPLPPAENRAVQQLEVDGTVIGQVYTRDDAAYLDLRDLTAVWDMDLQETTDGILYIKFADTAAALRGGSSEVEIDAKETRRLSAPVLRESASWYLPLDALEILWGRKASFDRENSLRRFLTLEPGGELSFNGKPWTACSLLGGVPTVSAEQLAAVTKGSLEQSAAADGSPVLTLRARGHALSFREGSESAAFNGESLQLPVPAWKNGDTWYLPLGVTGKALDCFVKTNPETGLPDLFQPVEGSPLWFCGMYLGASTYFDDTLCADLFALAEALGGRIRILDDSAVLNTPEHSLRFRSGAAWMESDGKKLVLPTPSVLADGSWFVPLRPVAEALGIPERRDPAGIVFSRMEPRETHLWVNGLETTARGLPDSPGYVRLQDVAEAAKGSFSSDGNSAALEVWGRTAALRGGSASIRIGEDQISLDAPVLAEGEDWYAPAKALLEALGLSELPDPDLDQVFYTRVVRNDEIPEGFQVPVLMYHAVGDFIWGAPELFVSPSQLEEQLQALLENGYTPITFEDLDRVDEIEKPVMLTFDDGYDDNYTELFPLLKKYKVKATIFVIVNDIGMFHKLTREQIREMSDSGLVSIQSHTMSHGYLDEMGWNRLDREHSASRLELARITGKQPFVLCYPTGRFSGSSVYFTAEYYEYGLCMSGPCYVTGSYPYLICRYYIPRDLPLATFLAYLN